MLEKLDEIPWQDLGHAYGSAENVPDLLRALAQPDRREAAFWELHTNIWHQGTVYEATSYAVPFLFELAIEPSVVKRDEIVGFIGTLADGRSYLDVHADPDLEMGRSLRRQPDFETRLANEKSDVRRTRDAVLRQKKLVFRLLRDALPMARAGAAHILGQFPEHIDEFGPLLRQAIRDEKDALARAAMLWCLGSIGDDSSEAQAMLDHATQHPADPREAFAAAIALYRITREAHPAAHHIYSQMTAATWFAEAFLMGVPWDFAADVETDELLSEFEPDPIGATQSLLRLLTNPATPGDAFSSIVHDLLELNFKKGQWRQCPRLTSIQATVLRSLTETDAAWKGTTHLSFLIPKGSRLSTITTADIQDVREAMRSVLSKAEILP